MTDTVERLVAKARRGDRGAFGELIRMYQVHILHLSFDLLGDWDLASDAAQDSFVKAWKKLATFEERAKFSSWLYRIAVNTCRDYQRREQRRRTSPIEEPAVRAQAERHGPDERPSDAVEAAESRAQLEAALATLTENQRTAITLRYFHDLSTREIAAVMACAENTVRIHVFRGMEKLRQRLDSLPFAGDRHDD